MAKGTRTKRKRERCEVIFALPLLLPLPDDYTVTHYAGEDGPDVTIIRFRWGEAIDSRAFGAITSVARESCGAADHRDRTARGIPGPNHRRHLARPLWDDAPHEGLSDPYFARLLRQVDNLLQHRSGGSNGRPSQQGTRGPAEQDRLRSADHSGPVVVGTAQTFDPAAGSCMDDYEKAASAR